MPPCLAHGTLLRRRAAHPVEHALHQLQAAGLLVDSKRFRVSGKFERCDVEGFAKGKQNGWYIAKWFEMPESGQQVVIGSFGYWQGTDNNAQPFRLKGVTLDPAAKERLKQARKALRVVVGVGKLGPGAARAGACPVVDSDVSHECPWLDRRRRSRSIVSRARRDVARRR